MGPLNMLKFGAAAALVAADVPTMPAEYETVILMKMPYIGMEMPLRVLTSATAQRIEYYDGLEVDSTDAKGTHKYVFRNGERTCLFSPSTDGPTSDSGLRGPLAVDSWKALMMYPDLTKYKFAGEELVGGIMCHKYTLDVTHGTVGTMDDHISFYWDPVLGKPVRWHMHSRHVIFGSHTDEYVMDYVTFQAGAPRDSAFALPDACKTPARADVSVRIGGLLTSAHAAIHSFGHEVDHADFEGFLSKYGKSYAPEEHARRSKIFARNVQLIKDLNRRHAGATRFRGNAFLDMTVEEVMRFRGGKSRGSTRAQRRTAEHLKLVSTHVPTRSSEPRPKNFDWRTAMPGVVGPVKDQGMCGSCWTYGLTEPIESIRAIQRGQPLVKLPEQFVVDCTWSDATNETAGNNGCDGGESDAGAFEIIRKYGGVIPTASSYGSYLSVDGHCKDTKLMDVGAKITGWVDVKARDEEATLDALGKTGPLSVSIMVPDEMLFYDSGVLKVESCKYDESKIDHSVVLTGFGTDEHGTDYYTIRNSWSTYWGDQGYIKVARGDLDCCISSEAAYPKVASEASELVI